MEHTPLWVWIVFGGVEMVVGALTALHYAKKHIQTAMQQRFEAEKRLITAEQIIRDITGEAAGPMIDYRIARVEARASAAERYAPGGLKGGN